jgi:23S rRNA (cytosine1962-C5)-methyltransferase
MHLRGRIILKPGRDGPVRGGNPWIFSQAIARAEPADLVPGDGVEVRDAGGDVLGFGYYTPHTTIAVRMIAFDMAVAPDAIVGHRINTAILLRSKVIPGDTNCYRLINGDGDGLSGVVVDRYGDTLVMQLLTAGAERMRDELVTHLNARLKPATIVERSQGAVRRQEGLGDRIGIVSGVPCAEVAVRENGVALAVDLEHGQKTGYFLDQRDNRMRLRGLASGTRVLDAYCYAGGFSLAALHGGAREVVAIDSSTRALEWAEHNLELNNGARERCTLIHEDALKYLAADHRKFDLVVIDPPPLARSAGDATRAGHMYVELNLLAMRVVAPGGRLMTFSCSAHFAGENFLRAVRIAQGRARRNFRLIDRLGPSPDHPVLLGHAEGEYLTGLLLADLG